MTCNKDNDALLDKRFKFAFMNSTGFAFAFWDINCVRYTRLVQRTSKRNKYIRVVIEFL